MIPKKTSAPFPTLLLVEPVEINLWGMPIEEWQRRAFAKIGVKASEGTSAHGVLYLSMQWVLSAPLAVALRDEPNTALIVENSIAGVNASDGKNADLIKTAILKNDKTALGFLGFDLKSPVQIAGLYNETLRKREMPFAISAKTNSISLIERMLFDSSYKGVTDFVTKYFWPNPAFNFTRLCAVFKITPNFVTTLSLILVLMATYFFWNGQWMAGFITGWGMTFLDTVDGKLARTTMSYSKWGNIYDHGIDLIHPPFWYWAWCVGLQSTMPDPPVWLGFCLWFILLGYLVDRVIEGLFIAKFSFHIHVWKPIDSFVRIYTARRNPNTFIFMLAIIATLLWPQAGFIGFALVGVWTWACIIFHLVRLLQAFLAPGAVRSWMV